jgi:sugar lactone lactonase YvrE
MSAAGTRCRCGLTAVLAGALVAGCEGPPETGDSTGDAWRLVEDLRIGVVDGEGPDVFGRIAGLQVGEDGRIYVLDAQARELRIFDSTGAHVRTVGRQGQGPGEFQSIVGMDWDPEGRLWVVDLGNDRYTLFDADGELVDHVPREVGMSASPWPGAIDDSGAVWEALRLIPDVEGDSITREFARLTPTGEVLDSLRVVERDAEMYQTAVPGGGTATFFDVVPFSSAAWTTVDPDGSLWAGVTGEYRLVKLRPTGDTLLVVERDRDPVPITETERQAALDDPGVRRLIELGTIDADLIPPTKPPLARVEVSEAGEIWAWLSAPGSDPGPIDRFQADGQLVGSVSSPQDFASSGPRPVILEDYVVGVVADSLGVQSVVRYHIER